ncbi:conserved hypothetical protein [Catenulispora acidiphila DSM 44928]|uniref:Secreted protein n=1 Tax=Catenulispora acidiphila (strain DSM 44928 / JCM 14897 / NBRC 102108 / NRRL B-24433 / ID139908) TaxID=479433 RepID=C7QF78_CATAD|nr:hypothetical protein [Catenulispora acidiphila]ACU74836.1 conserved hypothetical protein [Catenulispora acidiphila DSM 44928]
MAFPALFHRFRKRTLSAVAAAFALVAVAASPASAAAQPSGPYTGMGTCPTSSAQMRDPNQAVVGCTVATIAGGGFTVGSTQVNFTSPMTVSFGVTWAKGGPTVTFPDESTAELFSTVSPTDGKELKSSPLDVPIPGLSNFWPGVTSAIVLIEPAGPITNFAPLSAGEDYPLFRLPIKMHLLNAFLGLNCYVGSDSAPIVLSPTAGTTNPPAPNQPVKGSTGTISIARDPNGFNPTIVGFGGATLNDNALPVPGAHGCGLFDSADWIVNLLFGLPSAAGHNAITLSGVTTALAVDPSDSDLINAINATRK